MTAHLKQPQLFLDYLLPAGREKFRPEEVAKILSPDDGQAPVSTRSVRNALEAGQLFGNRIPFASLPGEEQRIRMQWLTRADLLHALLSTRSSPPATQLAHLIQIAERLPAEALDEFIKHLVHQRSRRPLSR